VYTFFLQGHEECVAILCKAGAEVNAVDLLKMTPLHHAVRKSRVSTVQTLLTFHADLVCFSVSHRRTDAQMHRGTESQMHRGTDRH